MNNLCRNKLLTILPQNTDLVFLTKRNLIIITNNLLQKINQIVSYLFLENKNKNLNLNDVKLIINSQDLKTFHTSASCKFSLTNILLKRDYYDVLGVKRDSTIKDIKKRIMIWLKKYHPDRNSNDKTLAKKFQEISEAYEVLGDENKRKQYDMYGMGSEQASGGGQGFGQARGYQNYQSQVDPEELFRTIFGDAFKAGGRGGFDSMFRNFSDNPEEEHFEAPQRVLDLTFEEACRGVNKEISLRIIDTCPECKGSRCAPGYKPQRCKTCNGSGMESVQTGPFFMRTTCRTCHGRRETIPKKCIECDGKGHTVQAKRVNIPVPAGVEDGQTMRINVGKQEVFITFKVANSTHFRRDKEDVHSDISISISQAILGGTVKFKGIYEDHTLKIPSGTQSHQRFRLSGKGIKRVHTSGYGDHYVYIKIKIPTYVNREQKVLIKAYAELDQDINGTVEGLTTTTKGEKRIVDDVDDLVKSIRDSLSKKTVTDEGEDGETDAKPRRAKKSTKE